MKRRKVTLAITFFSTLALAYGARLHHTSVSARVQTLVEIKRDIAARTDAPNDHAGSAQLASIRSLRDRHLSRIPDAADHGDLLERIAQDLAELGALERTLAVDPPQKSGGFKVLPITTTFRCSSESAHRFLKRIESSDQPLRITSLTMVRDERNPSDLLSVRIRMLSFAQAPEDPQ